MIVYGGAGTSASALGDTNVLTLSSLKWSRPVGGDNLPRQWHASVLVPKRNTMVVFGGERDLSTGAPEVLSELRTFDTDIMCWVPAVTNGKAPAGRSGLAAAVVHESTVVMFGGIRGRKWLDEVVCLNIANWRWTRPKIAGKAPAARSYHSATAKGDQVVFFGGNDGDRSFDKVVVLDASTERWCWQRPTTVGTAPCARTGHSATLLPDGSIAVAGGWDPNDSDDDCVPFNDVYILDTDSWEWSVVDTSGAVAAKSAATSGKAAGQSAPAPMFARTGHTAVFATLPEHGPGLLVFGGRGQDNEERGDLVFLPMPQFA